MEENQYYEHVRRMTSEEHALVVRHMLHRAGKVLHPAQPKCCTWMAGVSRRGRGGAARGAGRARGQEPGPASGGTT